VTVYRLPLGHRRGGAFSHFFEYFTFLLAASAVVSCLHLRRRYALVQVHTVPDALVFAALIPRLLGARVLLDLHECMPEFFATKFGLSERHPAVRLVATVEQASIRFANRAFTCTDQMKDAFVARGARAEKLEVVLNASDFSRECHPPQPRKPGQLTLICHGSVEPLYGLDTVVRAVARLSSELPGLTLKIYGDGGCLPSLRQLVEELGVGRHVYFSGGFVPLDELLTAISTSDVGVVAMRRDAFRDLVHCNKMYDYIAMGKPVICSRTRSVEAYFDDDCLRYFSANDELDLARAIRELYQRPELGQQMVRNADDANAHYKWDHQRRVYQQLAATLIGE
jgi:glycosyltransferase involved in cell wall biosynthesis